MVNITKYQVQLVKESTKQYGIDKRISSPDTAYEAVNEIFKLDSQAEEIFCVLALDTKNKIIGAFEVSRGSLNASIVHPREVFKRVLLLNANGLVIAHNHPSGEPIESTEDVKITKRLQDGAELLGLNLLDHIIVGEETFISFKEKGLL